MEDKLKDKVAMVDNISRKKDLKNKKRELQDAVEMVETIDDEMGRTKREIKLFKDISKLMLANYGKLPEKWENKWEIKDEYWNLMKKKQELDNERTVAKFENAIKGLEKQRRHTTDNIDGLKKSILIQEIELKEKNRGK